MGEFSDISKEAIKGMLRKYSNPSERSFVKQTLSKGGCPSSRIREAEHEISQGIGRKLLHINVAPRENIGERLKDRHYINSSFFINFISNRLTWYVIGGILLIIVLFILISKFGSSCDEQCFVDKANLCETAKYENEIAGAKIRYEINNCVLDKTVLKLSGNEPSEIRDLFKGKSMSCGYARGNFDINYLSEISANLDDCNGDLKSAILVSLG